MTDKLYKVQLEVDTHEESKGARGTAEELPNGRFEFTAADGGKTLVSENELYFFEQEQQVVLTDEQIKTLLEKNRDAINERTARKVAIRKKRIQQIEQGLLPNGKKRWNPAKENNE